jgi:tRNA nucleotidyltransferase (CCA-adding enzyme)
MRFSNAAIERVAGLVAGASAPPWTSDAPGLRRWLSRVGPECVPDLVRIWGARARVVAALAPKRPGPDEVARLGRRLRAELRSGAPIAVGDLALDGRDLIRMGRKPGPLFGEILHSLLDRVLEEPELNRKDVLAEMVEREWPVAGTAP